MIPGDKLGFCWRTGEGKEEGDGADRRARTVSEGGASALRARGERAEAGRGVVRAELGQAGGGGPSAEGKPWERAGLTGPRERGRERTGLK